MKWTIEWRDKDGIAAHTSGATFLCTRSGWVTPQESAGQSDSELQSLIAELQEVLANVAQKGDAIH